MKEIIIIVAMGPNRVIGDGNHLPWKLPRDMRLFRRLTQGHTVIMGRKTFESFGLPPRPLPRRRNIIITRNRQYQAPGTEVALSIEGALALLQDAERAFIIGGGEIYAQSMKYATAIVASQIFDNNPNQNLFPLLKGDVYFPQIDLQSWQELPGSSKSFIAASSVPLSKSIKRTGLMFSIRRYIRKGINAGQYARQFGREVSRLSMSTSDRSEIQDTGSNSGSLF